MHAANDAVCLEHNVAAGRRLEDGGIVQEREGSGMRRQRPEIARDQVILARSGLLLIRHRGTSKP